MKPQEASLMHLYCTVCVQIDFEFQLITVNQKSKNIEWLFLLLHNSSRRIKKEERKTKENSLSWCWMQWLYYRSLYSSVFIHHLYWCVEVWPRPVFFFFFNLMKIWGPESWAGWYGNIISISWYIMWQYTPCFNVFYFFKWLETDRK